jgi:hypothetical protein
VAGTIELQPGARWSAASWLFDWVLRSLAALVGDLELSAELVGIVDENLGWFDLGELPARQRAEVEEMLRSGRLADAAEQLPTNLTDREAVLQHIRDLQLLLDRSER